MTVIPQQAGLDCGQPVDALCMRVVRLDRSDYDFAGVHIHADLQIDSLFGPEALCVPPDVLLHPKPA
jgi:hypothetical protein